MAEGDERNTIQFGFLQYAEADLGVVSGGSVELPKLNVKAHNKREAKKKSEPRQLINICFENDISLRLCSRKQ